MIIAIFVKEQHTRQKTRHKNWGLKFLRDQDSADINLVDDVTRSSIPRKFHVLKHHSDMQYFYLL